MDKPMDEGTLSQIKEYKLVSEVSAPLPAAKLCDDRRNNT